MRQDVCSQPALSTEDDWSQRLPGFRLTHTIHLVSDINLGVVARVATSLKSECIQVSHWVVARRGDLLEQKIVLDDIGERQARAMRECLSKLQDVLRVRLEHRFVRCSSHSVPPSRESNF
jgi:hypothetical protein